MALTNAERQKAYRAKRKVQAILVPMEDAVREPVFGAPVENDAFRVLPPFATEEALRNVTERVEELEKRVCSLMGLPASVLEEDKEDVTARNVTRSAVTKRNVTGGGKSEKLVARR